MIEWSRRVVLGSLLGAALSARPGRATKTGAVGEVTLPTSDGRRCVVTRWRASSRWGTIIFSHGALSAPSKYGALIEPWVAAGFDVWAPLHVDSTDHPDTKNYPGLASWPARIADMRALSVHVGTRYVAAGHSYGALVALTLGGASPTRPEGVAGPLSDARAVAAVAFSPPGLGMGLIDAAGYASLAVPALIETGTADVPPGIPPAAAAAGWRGHLAAYDAPPPAGDRYALVLDGADHYFGGLICRLDLPGPPQRAQLDLAVSRSLVFLRGYGLGEERSRHMLQLAAAKGSATTPGLYLR